MAFAVIRTGGKQYRVGEGQVLSVEKLEGEAGQEIEFKDILLLEKDGGVVSDPAELSKVSVKARIEAHGRAKKIHILKFKRRKGFIRRQGHRQSFTRVRIQSIA